MSAIAMQLNKRITIQSLTQTKDTHGGQVDTWTDIALVWAGIKSLSGDERRITKEGGQAAEARTEFMIRYRAGIIEKMRVLYGGKIYNIKHVNDLNEGHRFMILTCDTGVNDGR